MIWYGQNKVTFNDSGEVIEWSNTDGNLRVNAIPGPNVTNDTHFSFGSHMDDVIRIQGTPTLVHDYNYIYRSRSSAEKVVWHYGDSSVTFINSEVIEWYGNLRARVPTPTTTTRFFLPQSNIGILTKRPHRLER